MDIGDADLFTQVNLLIKNDVNPSIAAHGGVITLHSVNDGKHSLQWAEDVKDVLPQVLP